MDIEVKNPEQSIILQGDAVLHIVKAPALAQARICPQCHELTWRYSWTCMWCGHDRLRTVYAITVVALLPALLIAQIAVLLL